MKNKSKNYCSYYRKINDNIIVTVVNLMTESKLVLAATCLLVLYTPLHIGAKRREMVIFYQAIEVARAPSKEDQRLESRFLFQTIDQI